MREFTFNPKKKLEEDFPTILNCLCKHFLTELSTENGQDVKIVFDNGRYRGNLDSKLENLCEFNVCSPTVNLNTFTIYNKREIELSNFQVVTDWIEHNLPEIHTWMNDQYLNSITLNLSTRFLPGNPSNYDFDILKYNELLKFYDEMSIYQEHLKFIVLAEIMKRYYMGEEYDNNGFLIIPDFKNLMEKGTKRNVTFDYVINHNIIQRNDFVMTEILKSTRPTSSTSTKCNIIEIFNNVILVTPKFHNMTNVGFRALEYYLRCCNSVSAVQQAAEEFVDESFDENEVNW